VHLKSLEIQGFKSFADRTVVHFDNNITSIVGPNGSGKSNISDAIRWVMGEMRSKELRGTKMEDVIFGGTQKRPAMGFAEATLTLDNSDGAFRMDTPEISITRRYYNSGESEYYINKQAVRLRDINELFMDTGLGREGYSNIGQGKIDEIVSLKSTDRREIFEEAAGISKYRHRKEETERRLANTEDNLLRIGDKITELELQIEPLRDQAEKAKKYLVFRDELRGLEVTVWLESLEKLAAAAQKAEADYNSAAFILEQQHSDLNRLYASADQYNLQLNQMDLQAEGMRDAISEQETQLQKQAADISVLEANLHNNEDNLRRIREELDDQARRSGGIAQQINEQKGRIQALRDELLDLQRQLDDLSRSGEETAREAGGLEQNRARLLSECDGVRLELNKKEAECATIRASADEVQIRRESILEDLTAAKTRLVGVAEQIASVGKAHDTALEEVTSVNNSIQGYLLRQNTRALKRDELQGQVDDLSIRERTVRSKLQMLQEMQRDFEGFAQPVKRVMQEAQRGNLQGVIGPVSSLIKTAEEYTVAIETALGAALQNVVVNTDQDGKACIRMLKQSNGGRITALPLNMLRPKQLRETGLDGCRGFVGLAPSLVQFDKKFDSLISYLLGTTVVCENLDTAVEMSKKYGSRFRIVTLDGQVMNAGGSMTGGSASKSAGILSRANAVERLEKELEELNGTLTTLRAQLNEAVRAVDEVEFQLSAARAQLRQAEDDALRLAGEMKQHEVLHSAISANIESYEAELLSIDSRSGNDELRLRELEGDISGLMQTEEKLTAEIAVVDAAIADAESRRQTMNDQGTELKIRSSAIEAERESTFQNISRLETLSGEMKGDQAQKESLIVRYENENRFLSEQIAAGFGVKQEKADLLAVRRQELQDFLAERGRIEQLRTRADKDAQEKNKELLLMEREAARLEQKKATTALEEKQIIDRLWDTYELTRTTAKDVVVEIDSLAAANRRISELKRKISALGTPNLGAIDEFARVNERYEYLTGQRDDVLHSKKELEEIVRTITSEMKEIFVREFGRINAYFGETFVEMFGGGKASLELEDPSEPLSTGIEIKVQPPGKQLKTITLLSGGEKAFVAIALYFAIMKVRPASFCLLDEIDAALDDRNVERFAGYLKNLSDKTQFIVITHRRGTMEASDALYGVTMQEHGISRILHIDLNQVQQQLGIEI